MKIEITDEVVKSAHDVFRTKLGGCPTRGAVRAALQAVAPRLANTAIEQVACEIQTQRNDVPAHGWEFAAAIRALKEPTP